MGVRQLNKLLQQHTQTGIKEIRLNKYSGKRIVVDISIYLYKFLHYNGDYLYGLLNQIIKLSFYRIIPIYVFDGRAPKQKYNMINKRKSKRENSYCKIELLENILNDTNDIHVKEELLDKIELLKKKTIHINSDIITNCKHLLDLLNVSYVTSIGEAEHLCCYLVNKDIAYACLSEDTDLIPLGCKKIIKNLYFRKHTVIEYDLNTILSELNISFNSLVDTCILCGTDYNNNHFKGINNEYSYYLIKKYNTIENIKDCKEIGSLDYQSIRNIYYSDYGLLDNNIDNIIQTILDRSNKNIELSKIIELFKSTSSKKHTCTIIDKLMLLDKNLKKYETSTLNDT